MKLRLKGVSIENELKQKGTQQDSFLFRVDFLFTFSR